MRQADKSHTYPHIVFLEDRFNILLSSISRSPKWALPFSVLYVFLVFLCVLNDHLILFVLIAQIMFRKEYNQREIKLAKACGLYSRVVRFESRPGHRFSHWGDLEFPSIPPVECRHGSW